MRWAYASTGIGHVQLVSDVFNWVRVRVLSSKISDVFKYKAVGTKSVLHNPRDLRHGIVLLNTDEITTYAIIYQGVQERNLWDIDIRTWIYRAVHTLNIVMEVICCHTSLRKNIFIIPLHVRFCQIKLQNVTSIWPPHINSDFLWKHPLPPLVYSKT